MVGIVDLLIDDFDSPLETFPSHCQLAEIFQHQSEVVDIYGHGGMVGTVQNIRDYTINRRKQNV